MTRLTLNYSYHSRIMSPSAVLPETAHELTKNAVQSAILQTAAPPSVPSSAVPSSLAPLDAFKTQVTQTTESRVVPEPNSLEVWSTSTCTDHMISVQWKAETGWGTPALKPHGPISLMPTASCLHYATECFEGMKVYRGQDGRIRLFRPDRNCARMLLSATRIGLPAFAPEELQKLIEKLVALDAPKWLPRSRPGSYLYLRPTMIGTGNALGVQKPKEALLFVIAICFPPFDEPGCASGPGSALLGPADTKTRKPGMKLLASKEDTVRAWVGGFGYAKVGANYGPTLVAQAEARALGYDQVLWLLGPQRLVTEAGASNFFVVWRTSHGATQLVTAPLDDKIILDGVTRRSVLELARSRLTRDWTPSGDGVGPTLGALEVVERNYTMGEIEAAVEEGRMVEAFVCGTAVCHPSPLKEPRR